MSSAQVSGGNSAGAENIGKAAELSDVKISDCQEGSPTPTFPTSTSSASPKLFGESPPKQRTSIIQAITGKGNVSMPEAERQERVSISFKAGDTASLVKYHEVIDLDQVQAHAEDSDGVGGDYIKSFVFGGLDGIVSTFALVAGLGGANVEITTLIAVGLSKVIADAFSMGFGEFTSASAELDHAKRVREREEWETDNFQEGEVKEMCEIYMKKGCVKEDALTLMTIMAKYRDIFIDHMMVMEHGIIPPDDDDCLAPLKQGFVCFLAFVVFGLVPLAGFIVMYAIEGKDATNDMGKTLAIGYGLTAFTLFVMGITKSKLTGHPNYIRNGMMMVVNGTIAGGVAYLIGDALSAVF